ncbi:facilitated trehalose transporter Tret1-like isoform X2 [Anthonomus grandis grandis]|uniref:facilitated trehalose transporter Tret1-like isoform X2 n=1 Tax=Anthonomus grandis grandis TaxID=2921223 RepID=UPI0021654629|nr:facilitated trehalose transporter Tret1-like isoform X2 [Anthonomus grandis grandis]
MTKKYVLNRMDVTTGESRGKRLPQYLAALSVCLGSVAAGSVLGWTGTISEVLKKSALNGIPVDENVLGWISGFATLGAMVICFPIGFICDYIGRKWACLLTIIPFTVGWLLVIFANGTAMLYIGRFLTGIAGGAFCVAAPLYTSEIAEKEIRGALGSYFQLLLTVGILFAYVLGAFCTPQMLSIICAFIPILFGLVFFFQPETPVYLLKKRNRSGALSSLRRLRGEAYNSENEIRELQEQLDRSEQETVSFFQALQTKAAKKALFICFSLMIIQQLSGVNAVIFFTSTIFASTGGSIDPNYATIGIGVVQVTATFIASLVIDKFGRKILLIGSAICMALSGCLLGIYFSLNDRHLVSKEIISDLGFLPIVSLVIFISVFSLGFGPIPWMAAAEIMPPEIKSTASSAVATFNWFLAFIVTRFFNNLVVSIGGDVTFYIFSGISLAGSVFVLLFVPETKGKTTQEIQDILSGVRPGNADSKGVENPNFKS